MISINANSARPLQDGIDLQATDVTGQRRKELQRYPSDSPVRQLIRDLVEEMGLPRANASGAPFTYRARLTREGRFLYDSEIVGEVLQSGDEVRLTPNIDAG